VQYIIVKTWSCQNASTCTVLDPWLRHRCWVDVTILNSRQK